VSILGRLKGLFGGNSQPAPAPVTAPAPDAIFGDQSAALSQERRGRQRINAREGTKVLIIDDSPTVLAALKRMLRSAGYVTVEALDGERGVELAREERPDLIFLDIMLPGMNGFAALRMMRRDAVAKTIPIIMMSGNEQATEQFYAQRIGADDFMKKPFSRFEVFARIERLLDPDLVPRRPALSGASAAQ
jgi:twitching motility two-component system response regulator PilH